MEIINQAVDLFAKVLSVCGVDLLIVAGIAGIGQFIKVTFKTSEKVIFIVLFSLGFVVAMLNIFIAHVPAQNIIRIALAYPVASMAGYMLIKKYLGKYIYIASTKDVKKDL